MNTILNPTQIQESSVKITCDGNQGTGFFISQNLIVTAYHVILDFKSNSSPISIILQDKSRVEGKLL